MFTSRAEYRILLRQDDADMRLTERAYQLGLVKADRYEILQKKRAEIDRIVNFVSTVKADKINDALEKLGTAPLTHGCKLVDLISRPQITIENIAPYIPTFQAALDKIEDRKEEVIEAAEIRIKYKGYIDRERTIADKIHRLESIRHLAITVDRSPPEAGEDRPGNPGTGQPHSRRITERHQRAASASGTIKQACFT